MLAPSFEMFGLAHTLCYPQTKRLDLSIVLYTIGECSARFFLKKRQSVMFVDNLIFETKTVPLQFSGFPYTFF
jgi:hypothetical protein